MGGCDCSGNTEHRKSEFGACRVSDGEAQSGKPVCKEDRCLNL